MRARRSVEKDRNMNTTKGLGLAAILCFASEAQARTPGIVPPTHSFHGMEYSEWAGEWWQWAYGAPVDANPVLDTTGEFADVGQSGSVWFLAGSFGATVTRTVTVPSDKWLFFPILNTSWINIESLGDAPWSLEEREYAWTVILPFLEADHELGCEIDGDSVSDLESYYVATADGDAYMVMFPENNLYEIDAGPYGPTIDAGYYLMLRPLSAGEHTIHITSAVDDFGFALDVTYNLTVEERDRTDHAGPGPGR
jgi:hypothetical protein